MPSWAQNFISGEIHHMSNNGARLNDIMEKYTFT